MYANMCRNCLNYDFQKHTCKEGWGTSCCGAGFDAIVDADILKRKSEVYDKIEVVFCKGTITFKYYKNGKVEASNFDKEEK